MYMGGWMLRPFRRDDGMQIRVGTISAMDLDAGTVNVKFPDRVATGLWLLDSVRKETLAPSVSVVCAFPMGSGEGFCLGRHYNQSYKPEPTITIDANLQINGAVNVSKDIITTGNITAAGNVTAANFP